MNFLRSKRSVVILLLLVSAGCGNHSDSSSSSAGPVNSITVTPQNGSITGSPYIQQFTAVAKDLNGQIVSGVVFFWSVIGQNTCIDQNGLATAHSSFETDTVMAQSGNITGSANLDINITGTPPPPKPPGGC